MAQESKYPSVQEAECILHVQKYLNAHVWEWQHVHEELDHVQQSLASSSQKVC
jgi:hypothetical protein